MIEAGEAGRAGMGDPGFLAALGSRSSRVAVAAAGLGIETPPRQVPPEVLSQAELVALVHIRAAGGLWHRQGGGRVAMAHRLAASLLFSLITPSSREWRLSPLVRDIVALGETALPGSLADLAAVVEPLAGETYLSVAVLAAGDRKTAEKRFEDVLGLARSIAREIAALP